jgi:hypothetical protein
MIVLDNAPERLPPNKPLQLTPLRVDRDRGNFARQNQLE